jgi:hypothetical protein
VRLLTLLLLGHVRRAWYWPVFDVEHDSLSISRGSGFPGGVWNVCYG